MSAIRCLISCLALMAIGGASADCAANDMVIGDGVVVTESRVGFGVKGVRVKNLRSTLVGDCSLLTVDVAERAKPDVVVTAEGNILPFIQTEIRDGLLHISLSRKVKPRKPIHVSATRVGKGTGAPPFEMEGLGCSAGFTMNLPLR